MSVEIKVQTDRCPLCGDVVSGTTYVREIDDSAFFAGKAPSAKYVKTLRVETCLEPDLCSCNYQREI
jgi:hypothetical protein